MINNEEDQSKTSELDDQDMVQMIEELNQYQAPIKMRQCTDLFCILILAIIFVTYFALGAYYLVVGQDTLNVNLRTIKSYVQQPLQVSKQIFIKHSLYLLSCLGFSIILDLIYIVVVIRWTKWYFYLLAITSGIVLAGTLVISIIDKSWILFAFSCFCLIIEIIFLTYFFSKKQIFASTKEDSIYINIGRNFTNQSTNSISKNKKIFILAFLGLLCIMLFTIFWLITLLIIQIRLTFLSQKNQDNKMQIFAMVYWCFILLYTYVFFYYYMVFLISLKYSFWYFSQPRSLGICQIILKGHYYILRYHIGSIAFASFMAILIKVPVTISNFFLWNDSKKLSRCCLFYLPCINRIEDIGKYLSKYSIIAMAYFGHSYIKCARIVEKIVKGLNQQHRLELRRKFLLIDTFFDMFQYGAVITNCGLPALVCYLIVTITNINERQLEYFMTTLYIFTFLLCLYFSLFFVSIVTVCNSCIIFQAYLYNYCVKLEQKKKILSNKENQAARYAEKTLLLNCPQEIFYCFKLIANVKNMILTNNQLIIMQVIKMNLEKPMGTERKIFQLQRQ